MPLPPRKTRVLLGAASGDSSGAAFKLRSRLVAMLVSQRSLQMLAHSDLVVYSGLVLRGVGVDMEDEAGRGSWL